MSKSVEQIADSVIMELAARWPGNNFRREEVKQFLIAGFKLAITSALEQERNRVCENEELRSIISQERCLTIRALEAEQAKWNKLNNQLGGENKELRLRLEEEERAHLNTIDHRDQHEERLNKIFGALGMSEEDSTWSNLNDPSERAVEQIDKLRKALLEFVRVENSFGHTGQHGLNCADCGRVTVSKAALKQLEEM